MYKGFFEDMEYVMGLFFKPFENCCEEAEEKEDDEERDCGMGCDVFPCMKAEKDENEKEPEEEHSAAGGLLGPGHNTFFTDAAGEVYTSYHARQYDEIVGDPLYDPNRHCYIMRVPFEDGLPVFSAGNQMFV